MSQPNYIQEVRFGAVFFGGGSLAIYENGVAQELLRLVHSTCDDARPFKTQSTEEVYKKVAAYLAGRVESGIPDASTRFVVDILSGTSAGGINSVFLGKALTSGQSLATIHDLWLGEADMATLLNDGSSLSGLNSNLQKVPKPERSLLNSQRMYALLYKALEKMDEEGTSKALVSECDVWVTATDLAGMSVPVRLSFQQANEHIFKHAFHFRFDDGETLNQFTSTYNPILAFAARCTSSFPLAFEPVSLADIDPILGSAQSTNGQWNPFFQNYTNNSCEFHNRYFADGGYLHNKPISFVVDELLTRRAAVPVSRKVIYIDPFPESGPGPETSKQPSALVNLLDAGTSLPRYQTVREEIQRVMEHNRLVDRIDRIIRQTQAGSPPAPFYWNLRVSSVTDEISHVVSRALGLEEDAISARAVRALVRAWRNLRYPHAIQTEAGAKEFLGAFDLSYLIRRLDYILKNLNSVETRKKFHLTPHNDLLAAYRGAADILCDRKDQLYLSSEKNPILSWINAANAQNFHTNVRTATPPNRLAVVLTITDEDLLRIVGLDHNRKIAQPLLEEEAEKRAMELLTANEGRGRVLDGIAQELAGYISQTIKESQLEYAKLRHNPDPDLETAMNRVHCEFDNYDSVVFPITFGIPLGEGGPVDVIRISPADRVVFDTRRSGNKLMGELLGSFGGFLDRKWREFDLMWGRIDAAEQIITALLNRPDPQEEAAREDFIVQACCAILRDENVGERAETKELCQQALDDFDRQIPTQDLPAATKLELIGRATKIAGGVIVDTAHSAHRGRLMASGLQGIATVLGVAAIAGAIFLKIFAQPQKR